MNLEKPPLVVRGMWGIGDNIHQRAVLRELMKTRTIWLDACCVSMFHDFIDEGLHVIRRPWGTGAAARVRDARERAQFDGLRDSDPPPGISDRKHIGYDRASIKAHGSILAAQFASVGITKMPERPDFSMPVPQFWKDKANEFVAPHYDGKKPLLVYRPVILNKGWECPARAPDVNAYDTLYRSIRERFFVVSVANLVAGYEWIVGPKPDVDLELTNGELDFESMAGLFAMADMVFGNPGFAPVLAQAVGTPLVVVYGGNETWADTNSVGAHLASTLAIEPINPCACHQRFHNCKKEIDMEPALEKLDAFVNEVARPVKTLIFGTMYSDTDERKRLTELWETFHDHVNPGCTLTLIDSNSPKPPMMQRNAQYVSFPENIGHLSRNGSGGPQTRGQDGWGRAFCRGLQMAIDSGYDYVAHIEGDSLLRIPVADIVKEMRRDNIDVVSVPVNGTRRNEIDWVETGLMVFRVGYLVESDFIKRYDWPGAQRRPTPEAVIFKLLGPHLKLMPWRALRGDKNQITDQNIMDLDWVTHCRLPERPGIDDLSLYERYAQAVFSGEAKLRAKKLDQVKINLGCGNNKLEGWKNYDKEIDITKPLPFKLNSADFIFAEHVIEHVEYFKALAFLGECFRVLRPGGIVRIACPSIENVMRRADEEYVKFIRKWVTNLEGTRAAMHNILFFHGHKAPWTDSLLEASLFYAGFKDLVKCDPGHSKVEALQGVEGHGKVIGDRNNWIETIVWEGTVDK